jgi:hypothetical protein
MLQTLYTYSEILAGLLKHAEMRLFCEKYEGQTLVDVHKSFTNMDKISALIQKDRILRYTHGVSIPAVEHEYRLNHEGNPNQVRTY